MPSLSRPPIPILWLRAEEGREDDNVGDADGRLREAVKAVRRVEVAERARHVAIVRDHARVEGRREKERVQLAGVFGH